MEYRAYSHDKVQVLALSGKFDMFSNPPVRRWIEETLANSPAYIVINLEKVNFLDSSALATLVLGLKRSRQSSGNLHLCCLQRPVRILFELTRMDQAFEIFPCEEDAINAFASVDLVSQS
jgi:anti-sigma B factor antagonist